MVAHLIVQLGRLVVLLSGEVEIVRIFIITEERRLFALVLLLLSLLFLLRHWVLVTLLPAGLATASSKEWLLPIVALLTIRC